ncbi:MAG: gamma-glutamyl-gamma-aminobutyrate hydrolase family protein [Alphaproteobacteria bacterium]|nr:gamma-glutamyl-gamma-aminobutyrate hydrolase family protein [Alphaproteobacteria bacterium]
MTRRPLVGVSGCIRKFSDLPFHAVLERYLVAVAEAAECVPVAIPALGEREIPELIERFDGILLTGSPSNVEPHRYDGPASRPETLHDPARDATTLPLIRAAIAGGVPLFAICRGHQELNVAFGGSLHQYLQEVPGRMDHRRDRSKPLEEGYAPRHPVEVTPGGVLAKLVGEGRIKVNSLHGQGVDRVGEGLAVEARAEDGTVEALSVKSARRFALGVQWHAEWRPLSNPVSTALFRAFGSACRDRLATRSG